MPDMRAVPRRVVEDDDDDNLGCSGGFEGASGKAGASVRAATEAYRKAAVRTGRILPERLPLNRYSKRSISRATTRERQGSP